jgi:hypothetical protein
MRRVVRGRATEAVPIERNIQKDLYLLNYQLKTMLVIESIQALDT